MSATRWGEEYWRKAWRDFVFLPLQAGGDSCSDPIVRFSPDGLYAYYFYMDIAGGVSDTVMVRASGYNPKNILSGPIVVMTDYGDFLDKLWGDVAYYDSRRTSDPAI